MATVNKDFKIKYGLIVEGSSGTINGYDILTKSQSSQDYIVGLIGGTATSANTPDTVVKRDGSGNFSAGTITANLTGQVSDISNHDTDDLAEGLTRLYFTDARARAALSGGTGLDYNSSTGVFDIDSTVTTNTGAQTLTNKTIDGLNNTLSNIGNASLVNDSVTVNGQTVALGSSTTLDTDDIGEGSTNLYFLDSRARNAVSAGDGLNYNSTTGEFSAHLGNGLEISNGAIRIDDTIVVTETDLSTAISNHSNLTTGVHGVTGDVVGTTDAQTLSNKALGSDLDADGYKITNLGTPSNAGDAATKAYVDGSASGLTWKQAVNLLAVSNVPLTGNTGTVVIDGHAALADGDDGYRLLLKGQTTNSENGIYVYSDNGTTYTLTRASDADAFGELIGAAVFVMEGNTYASTSWVQTDHYITDFSGQDWVQFSGSGTYVAGNGLDLNGNEFSIDTTVTATVNYVDTEIGNHASDTTTHGVTGNIVGTSDTQTLTNKTLGSGTVLSANIDAANTYTVENLEEPVNNQDAATKFYVDNAISGVSGDLTTHENAVTGIHGVTGNIVGTSDSQTLTNKTIDGGNNTLTNIANASLVNDSVTVNGQTVALGSSTTLDTDDIGEGATNLYYTDNRAKDAAGYILENATVSNISFVYDETTHSLTVTAENGVADSTTDDLDEGTSNLYFTDQRAVDALEAVVPNFTAIEVNSVAKQVAATLPIVTPSTETAYAWAKADYRSAKFMVKFASGSHTEVSEILVTLDTSDNVAVTEYAIVGTNGSLGDVTADVSGTDVRIRVTTINNNTDVTVVGTLLV